jgi:hypothetical protein
LKAEERLALAKSLVSREFARREEKKGVNNAIQKSLMDAHTNVVDVGNLENARKAWHKADKLIAQRKELNKKINYLSASVYEVILGDGKYGDEQMRFDDIDGFVDSVEAGEVNNDEAAEE